MPKNGLAKDAKVNTIVSKIIQKVSDIPNHNEYRANMELLKMICIMVEHAVDNKEEKIKIDKKDIVFQVYTRLWNGIRPEEIKNIENNIQFLWENGQIKKKSTWYVIKHSIYDWVQRKILN
jgi:cell division protein ZapA (FtsZ GTPase activity inhibitor)